MHTLLRLPLGPLRALHQSPRPFANNILVTHQRVGKPRAKETGRPTACHSNCYSNTPWHYLLTSRFDRNCLYFSILYRSLHEHRYEIITIRLLARMGWGGLEPHPPPPPPNDRRGLGLGFAEGLSRAGCSLYAWPSFPRLRLSIPLLRSLAN